MTTIDQIINQVSNFTQELSLASVGSFGGRVVTFVTSTPVILVAIAAILAIGVCIYMGSKIVSNTKKASKLDEPKKADKLDEPKTVQQHPLLVQPSACKISYALEEAYKKFDLSDLDPHEIEEIKKNLENLKKIQLPLLPKANYFIGSNNQVEQNISFDQIDPELPIVIVDLQESAEGLEDGLRKIEIHGKKCYFIQLECYESKVDLRESAVANRNKIDLLCTHGFKINDYEEVMGIVSQMADSLK